ncbi:MAG: M15 family metallopeptidase [Calditrichae bacterium]|nr:M15 family metallopeptidase [Calditrichota bacterium]MCB9057426.1 M15 family metallopeptidase [Calditrichia bacterium]
MKIILLILVLAGFVFAQSGTDEPVNVKDLIPDIVTDIRYNTTNNFTGQKLYSTDECFYSLSGTRVLQQIQDSLHQITEYKGRTFPKGLGLKIFDAYRPHTVQFLMWDIVGPPFVASPTNGSNHNRGSAVDLTIIDMATGNELNMGTDFDFFGPEAGHDYNGFEQEILDNRILLKNIMSHFNFTPYTVEWWHYSFNPALDYPLLDFQLK